MAGEDKSDFVSESVGYPFRRDEFSHIDRATRKKLLNILTSVTIVLFTGDKAQYCYASTFRFGVESFTVIATLNKGRRSKL